MLTYTGTVNFDREIDSVALPAHLAACFRRQMDARTIEIASNRVTFRGSVFAAPFRFVELTVDCAACAVHYRLSLRWLILAAIWLALAPAVVIAGPPVAGDPPKLVALTWMWFGGTILFVAIQLVTAIPRSQCLVRRAIASAPAKPH